ncbi:MAG: hypothetical protein RLZ98_351 [Pseudomonadota bacterium]|jgi:hypothetical protein
MREIIRTNDPVVLSFAEGLLKEAELYPMIADDNISVMEGSIGAFPKRLLVHDEVYREARDILIEAGLGQWILDA